MFASKAACTVVMSARSAAPPALPGSYHSGGANLIAPTSTLGRVRRGPRAAISATALGGAVNGGCGASTDSSRKNGRSRGRSLVMYVSARLEQAVRLVPIQSARGGLLVPEVPSVVEVVAQLEATPRVEAAPVGARDGRPAGLRQGEAASQPVG